MAYVNADFTTADAAEIENYSFDFTARLQSPEVPVNGGTWYLKAVVGTDNAAKSRITGSSMSNGNIVTQKIGPLIASTTYVVQVVVTTTAGRTLSAWSHIPVDIPM